MSNAFEKCCVIFAVQYILHRWPFSIGKTKHLKLCCCVLRTFDTYQVILGASVNLSTLFLDKPSRLFTINTYCTCPNVLFTGLRQYIDRQTFFHHMHRVGNLWLITWHWKISLRVTHCEGGGMVSQGPWLQMTDALFTMLAGNNIVTSTGSPVKIAQLECTLPVSTDSD